MLKIIAFLPFIVTATAQQPAPQIDYILVEKSKRQLKAFSEGKLIKSYRVALGFSPKGHKQKEKDWTLGCVALTNEEIEELYKGTKVGTIVEIEP